MVRQYARFSLNRPWAHRLFLLTMALMLMVSVYQVLANESLVYIANIGLVACIVPLFAMASDYKRKYLHD
ncbi:hypothetical protein C9I98_04160 [Photobacterium sanctipauli]|uniref:Uncharacterized protein n=1 Tax=Photobacterium sanctipauli TaxID=1342794 RepID=A0A2T3NXX0_9GAMM|nr:hypothetical protein [Photobacterium sanctipauli]PSW21153.1 hypothetical protein C9I98_04160 [Photobacterium sanctipauli]